MISLAGEVDLYTAPEFKQQLLDVIGEGGKDVIVDFSDTTFIDSTTLGVLVGGVKRLRANDGQLSLVCSDRNITKIFEITGLDRVFTIYPTRDEAVAKTGASTSRRRCGRSPGVVLAALIVAVGTGCGTGGPAEGGDASSGKKLFLTEGSAAAATRWRTPARTGRSARTSTMRSGRSKRGLRGERDRERRPRPDPVSDEGTASCRPTSSRARTSTTSPPTSPSAPRDPDDAQDKAACPGIVAGSRRRRPLRLTRLPGLPLDRRLGLERADPQGGLRLDGRRSRPGRR